jgi:hypothetical protein
MTFKEQSSPLYKQVAHWCWLNAGFQTQHGNGSFLLGPRQYLQLVHAALSLVSSPVSQTALTAAALGFIESKKFGSFRGIFSDNIDARWSGCVSLQVARH